MNVGRNDPCPCGSGRKYKKCCLGEASSAARADPAQERDSQRTSAFGALLRFANRPQFREARDAAFDLFMAGGDWHDVGNGEPLDDDVYLKFSFFFLFDLRLPDGRTVAETFLQRAGWQVDRSERALIERFGAARVRPYEVQDVREDEGMRLRDLWSGRDVWVTERAGTHQLTQWDILAARIAADDDGTLRLEGGIYLLPRRSKRALLDVLEKEAQRLRGEAPAADEDRLFREAAPLFHRFWLDHVVHRLPPAVVTAEGDALEFGKVVFDVTDRATLVAALGRHPQIEAGDDGTWTWFEALEDDSLRSLGRMRLEGDRLVLEVTSRARAERGRELLAEAAPGAVRHRSSRYESVASAMERHRAAKADEPARTGIDPKEAAALILEYKDRHYRTWPDEPLPALEGGTPRQAARSRVLRPRLIDVLEEIENAEARAARPESPPYDFGWIWDELELKRPESPRASDPEEAPVERRRLAVNWDDLQMALTWHDAEGSSRHFLDLDTGEVIFWQRGEEDPSSDDIDEALLEGRMVPIDPLPSSVAYGWMEEFTATVGHARVRGQLERALGGHRPFRRVKDALEDHPSERERWFAFEAQRLRAAAQEWLEEHGLETDAGPR